ncbi:MAG TPA: hypothetical protein VG206_17565 [Terriglobia bacterium]|nr:hypothetical protein [Terriglobia bacterium]
MSGIEDARNVAQELPALDFRVVERTADELEARVGRLERRMCRPADRLDRRFDEFEKHMDKRFDEVMSGIQSLIRFKLDSIERRVAALESRQLIQ